MAIYVDGVQTYPAHMVKGSARRHGMRWCHLVTDGSIEGLHEFAQRIGCSRSWFQRHSFWDHYDLTPYMRQRAIDAGAIPVNSLAQLARRVLPKYQ